MSPRLAEVLALRQPPVVRGRRYRRIANDDGLAGSRFAERYRKMAEAAGVSTAGKRYEPTLARFPGDPKAWCSDLDDVRQRCIEQGVAVDGAVNYKPPKRDAPPKPYRVADDIVEEVAAASRPDLDELPAGKRREVLEEVRERITPKHLDE